MSAEPMTLPLQDVRTDVRTDVRQQVRQSIEQTRIEQAELRERIREAVEMSRQATAVQGGASGGGGANAQPGLIPPPPTTVHVMPDGRVVVDGQPVADVGVIGTPRGADAMPISEQTIRDISMGFFMMVAFIAVALPLIRLVTRWVERRPLPQTAIPADVGTRLDRIEQAVEAVAIEVERISEGQRFTSRLISELRAAPQLERVTEQRG